PAFLLLRTHPAPAATFFPYTTLFRSRRASGSGTSPAPPSASPSPRRASARRASPAAASRWRAPWARGPWVSPRRSRDHFSRLRRSEEHTSELQSRENLVCRLLLEKKK